MARSASSARSAWAPPASSATRTAASSPGQRTDQPSRAVGRRVQPSGAGLARSPSARPGVVVGLGAAGAAPTGEAAAGAAAPKPPPGPRPVDRGVPRSPPPRRSLPPHVRGAQGVQGAREARGRTRRQLIGRRRLRFLLPECDGAPVPSSPARGTQPGRQVQLPEPHLRLGRG